VCSAGTCGISCLPGQVECNGECVNPNTDRRYCGAGADCVANPGVMCLAGEICDGAGACQLSCQNGRVDCNGTCIDPMTDRQHCGAQGQCTSGDAGVTCASGEVCVAGACDVSCPIGQVDCNGECVSPDTDRRYCGAGPDCAADPGVSCTTDEFCNGTGVCEPLNGCPTAPIVPVSPVISVEGDALQCTILVDATDPDGDPIAYDYLWLLDGAPTAQTNPTIAANVTVAGAWTCQVTASDVDGAGGIGTSTALVEPLEWSKVTAGGDHTCALNSTGSVVCWGDNSQGQASPPTTLFKDIDAGSFHVCGITQVDTVQCW